MNFNINPKHTIICNQILSLLDLTEGFEIIFIQCNPPFLQQQLEQYLKEQNAQIDWINVLLEKEIKSLKDEILSREFDIKANTVISVRGLEKSIHDENEPADVVARLNLMRDVLPDKIPCPMLIWLPYYALQNVARFAPDLWSWRAGVFYIETEEKESAQPQPILETQTEVADKYSKAYKESQIEYLTSIINEFDEETATNRDRKTYAQNLIRLAHYHDSLSHFSKALVSLKIAEKILEELNEQKWLSTCYNNIGSIYDKKGDWDQALEYYLKSEKIQKEVGDKAGLAPTYNNIGYIYSKKGDWDQALEYCLKSEKIFKEMGHKAGLGTTYNNIGGIYSNKGDWDQALDYYLKSEKIQKEVGDKAGLAPTYNNIGLIYSKKGDWDQALDYYLKSETISKDVGHKAGLGTTYNNIGGIYDNKGDWDQALEYYLKSETIQKEVGDKAGLGTTYNNIGLIYFKKEDWDQALEYYLKSETIRKEVGDKAGLGYTYLNIAAVYYQLNDKRAMEYIDKSVAIFRQVGARHELGIALQWQEGIYKEFGVQK